MAYNIPTQTLRLTPRETGHLIDALDLSIGLAVKGEMPNASWLESMRSLRDRVRNAQKNARTENPASTL